MIKKCVRHTIKNIIKYWNSYSYIIYILSIQKNIESSETSINKL